MALSPVGGALSYLRQPWGGGGTGGGRRGRRAGAALHGAGDRARNPRDAGGAPALGDLFRRGAQRRALSGPAARDRCAGPRGRLPRLAPRAVGRAERGRAGREPRPWPGRLREHRPGAGRDEASRRPARGRRARCSARCRPALLLAGRSGRQRRGRDRAAALPVAPRRCRLHPAAAGPGARTDERDRRPGRSADLRRLARCRDRETCPERRTTSRSSSTR